jgi:hypothetical protein
MNEQTEQTVRQYAREIADEIISAARTSGDDPIAWVTGNAYMPPLRSFTQAEQVWQMYSDAETAAEYEAAADAWELLVELVESHVEDANVTLECPEYDNSLYAVDLNRFEYRESDALYSEDAHGETLQDDWIPKGGEPE